MQPGFQRTRSNRRAFEWRGSHWPRGFEWRPHLGEQTGPSPSAGLRAASALPGQPWPTRREQTAGKKENLAAFLLPLAVPGCNSAGCHQAGERELRAAACTAPRGNFRRQGRGAGEFTSGGLTREGRGGRAGVMCVVLMSQGKRHTALQGTGLQTPEQPFPAPAGWQCTHQLQTLCHCLLGGTQRWAQALQCAEKRWRWFL